MPTQVSYPGVYIEEIPSGVRTITGVATSITAFIGRTPRGLVDEPRLVTSFGDFERQFGNLHQNYPLTYAVKDFFLNGGSQALIVRLFKVEKNTDGKDINSTATVTTKGAVSDVKLQASSPGTWGNRLEATTDIDGIFEALPGIRERYGLSELSAEDKTTLNTAKKALDDAKKVLDDAKKALDDAKESEKEAAKTAFNNAKKALNNAEKSLAGNMGFFNLTVTDTDKSTGAIERFLAISKNEAGVRYIKTVLERESQLVRFNEASGATNIPASGATDTPASGATDTPASGGTDGGSLDYPSSFFGDNYEQDKKGLYALAKADLFNLLCIPPDTLEGNTSNDVYAEALAYCKKRRALLIVDPPSAWKNGTELVSTAAAKLSDLNLTGEAARNGAIFYPRVKQADPTREGEIRTFVPCGVVAGIMARTDSTRGVWKAPAGLDATLSGVQGLEVNLNDTENGVLNQLGINCLRAFPVNGKVVWGSRTLRGADQLADEYKYIPVRRLVLFIEESLYRGTQWAVFEPNDEPLWAQLRLNIGAFMNTLFRQGAFQGRTPQEAYFVRCDKETTTQNDINLGIVNVVVGFAPLKPAEFVVIKIQQIAGQIAV